MDWELSRKQWAVVIALAAIGALATPTENTADAIGRGVFYIVPWYFVACAIQSVTGWGATASDGEAAS